MTSRYLLDANVFIEAYKRYYAFDIAPAFWNNLALAAQDGLVMRFLPQGRVVSQGIYIDDLK